MYQTTPEQLAYLECMMDVVGGATFSLDTALQAIRCAGAGCVQALPCKLGEWMGAAGFASLGATHASLVWCGWLVRHTNCDEARSRRNGPQGPHPRKWGPTIEQRAGLRRRRPSSRGVPLVRVLPPPRRECMDAGLRVRTGQLGAMLPRLEVLAEGLVSPHLRARVCVCVWACHAPGAATLPCGTLLLPRTVGRKHVACAPSSPIAHAPVCVQVAGRAALGRTMHASAVEAIGTRQLVRWAGWACACA